MLINPVKKETALHVAVRSGNKKMVVEFLKSLPQLLLCDDTGEETSLHIAAAEGNEEIAAIFLELVEQSGFFAKSLVDKDGSGNVPLSTPNADSRDVQVNKEIDTSDPFSVEDLDVEIASRKIDPFHQTKRDRHTPLHLAVDNGHLGIIQLYYGFVSHLVEENSACADKLIGKLELLNKRGLGAFHCAALKGNIPAMDLLLKMGVNINTRVMACHYFELRHQLHRPGDSRSGWKVRSCAIPPQTRRQGPREQSPPPHLEGPVHGLCRPDVVA